jgi:nicotinate-nucleotide adenylyltransferase
MRLGLFGGTFNPIHIGHLRVAEEVRESLNLEKVIFVPSYLPPHKELADNVQGEKRLEIVRLSIKHNPYFAVSSFEVNSRGNSYSIKTIEHIRQTYECIPYFILGQDAFNEISTWFEADKLFDLAHFVVMSRPEAQRVPITKVLGGSASRFTATDRGFINEYGNEIVFVAVTPYAVSSSMIRELCKKGRSIRYLVPEEVYDYIIRERIYV